MSSKKNVPTSTDEERRGQMDTLRHVFGLSPDDPEIEVLKRALKIALYASISRHPLLKESPPPTIH